MRKCDRNNPSDTQVSDEGGGGDTPGVRAEVPLQLVVRLAVLLQLLEVTGGAEIHTVAFEGFHAGPGGYVLKEAEACGDPMLE